MSIPRYRTGERVRVIVEGPIVDVLASGVELTVALETPNASYEVTVPTSHVTIERLAPEADAPRPEADEPREPRPMLGDVWEDGDDDEWEVVEAAESGGGLQLRYRSLLLTWAQVNRRYGPPALIERAGYRPTGGTVPAERLTIGMVVSHPDWVGGAPVLLTAPRRRDDERAYELLGDGEAGAGVAGVGALFTVWEPAGGAR